MRRRRHDPFDLDPASTLRWHEVEALKDLVDDPDDPASALWPAVDQDTVLLAAFVKSVFGSYAPTDAAQLARALGLSNDQTSKLSFLVTEGDLLPAAAARLTMGAEETVLEVAAHIGDRARCDALYLLEAAGEEDPTARERLDELRALVAAALSQPELADTGTIDLVEARKQEVLRLLPASTNVAVHRLLESAPRRYVLAHEPDAIARHIQMLDPPPSRNEVRIFPDPDLEHDEWTLYVATPDRTGALAAIAGALASSNIPIVEASITTFPSGLAADIFRVSAPAGADWETVRKVASAALLGHGGRNGKPQPIDGHLEIDNAASPWHTIAEVRAHDRTGLLQRVAEAFSRAGIQIHHATARTVNGVAVDTFLVTGPDGHKLDRRRQTDLRLSFEGRLPGRWTPSRLWRRPGSTDAEEMAGR
jgi:UTP:GlnB (protein PII) uridylyltransferase